MVTSFTSEATYGLDFASKTVTLQSGAGGLGLDVGKKLGKGGAGGDIVNINIDAQNIVLKTGPGGNSTDGAAGAGGSISNSLSPTVGVDASGKKLKVPGSFKTATGLSVVPKLVAEALLEITVGNGGTPTGTGATKAASGGAGGNIVGLDITLTDGTMTLVAGTGGNGKAGVGGAGGDVRGVTAIGQGGGLNVIAGAGGSNSAGVANAGAGGSIVNLKYQLALDADTEREEVSYSVLLQAGSGGASFGGMGGAGGRLDTINLKLDGASRTFDSNLTDPPLVDAHLDSTVTVVGVAGAGGSGAKGGGAGGSIIAFTSETVYDQSFKGFVLDTYSVLTLVAGGGGSATAGNGGAGGSVIFKKAISGVSEFDPDSPSYDPGDPALTVIAGAGGSGTVKGGAGGSISGLTAQNSAFFDGRIITQTQLSGAVLIGGAGGAGGTGNGGDGGSITNSLLGVSGGQLIALAGSGGASDTGKGGNGGAVSNSEFGLVGSDFAIGMTVQGGFGGNGNSGGAGGGLIKLRINTPQSTDGLSAILIAGTGGAADTANGVGGKGGDVNGISQAKDFNSSINLIQAGNGGSNSAGKGGAGGSVLNVRTVGFLGRPSDGAGNALGVFDGVLAQGVFAGRGGDGAGAADGLNGSISNIAARQIAAMAAAPNSNGLFAAATKISGVKAALIGFDVNKDGECDDENGMGLKANQNTPATVKPLDGFLMATTIANIVITGNARPDFIFDV